MAKKQEITINAPNFETAVFKIRGTAPYVQNKFSRKAADIIKQTQEAGSTKNIRRKQKEPKNFQEQYEQSIHQSEEGWYGIPAPAFRTAMVSACRTVGFTMTLAKLSVFIRADGFDADDQTPLVKITKGDPTYFESLVRLASGVADIHARALWKPGWEAILQVNFDADQLTAADVTNLLVRVGFQVGIGEGRPDSKKSCGMGWGLFEVIND